MKKNLLSKILPANAPKVGQIIHVPAGGARAALGGCAPAWAARNPVGPDPFLPGCGGPANSIPFAQSAAEQAPVDPSCFVQPGQVQAQAYVPLPVISQSLAAGALKRIETAPKHGRMYICGIKSLNDPFEILIHNITLGGSDASRLARPDIDSAVYSADRQFDAFDGGCIDNNSPLCVEFRSFGTPTVLPFINLHFFGTKLTAFNSCDPGQMLAMAAAQANGNCGF